MSTAANLNLKQNIDPLFLSWKFIEKKVFSPVEKRGIIQWVKCYGDFLYNFWQLDCPVSFTPGKDSITGKILFTPLNLEYSYSILFNLKKFDFAISLKGIDDMQQSNFKLENSYDDQFFTELNYIDNIWPLFGKIEPVLKKMNIKEIDYILKGVIVHPAMHQHIKYSELIPHHIRIINGVNNPFLFLYQLAFQLGDCFSDFKKSELKNEEFNRITDLVWRNIIQPEKSVIQMSPGDFFNL